MLLNHAKIRTLIGNADRFWDYAFVANDRLRADLERAERRVTTFVKLFLMFAAVTAVLFTSRPYLSGSLTLICYVPRAIPFQLFALFNNLVFLNIVFIVAAYDSFVLITLIYLIIQFRILNEAYSRLDFSKGSLVVDQIKICVDHHKFLLEYEDKFKQNYQKRCQWVCFV